MPELSSLFRMTFRDAAPAVWLVLLPVLVAVVSRRGVVAATTAAVVALSTPFFMLVWGAPYYGEGRQSLWVSFAPLAIGAIGLGVLTRAVRRLRPLPPAWSLIGLVIGSLVLWALALFVSGMAVADDWV